MAGQLRISLYCQIGHLAKGCRKRMADEAGLEGGSQQWKRRKGDGKGKKGKGKGKGGESEAK